MDHVSRWLAFLLLLSAPIVAFRFAIRFLAALEMTELQYVASLRGTTSASTSHNRRILDILLIL